MSYCRWSSDDWKCDLYVYEHVAGGFVIHIAGNRVVGAIPEMPDPHAGIEGYMAAHRAQMTTLAAAERIAIDLPHAGESLSADTVAECLDEVLRLRDLGYHVPDFAIEALREETAAFVQIALGAP